MCFLRLTPSWIAVLALIWLHCFVPGESLCEETAPPSLHLLFVGDAISERVGSELLGFFAADDEISADVRFIDIGEESLGERWAADDFLDASLIQGGWDVVFLQEKMFLPSFAALAEQPEAYDEEGVPEAVAAGREAFWLGAPVIGETVLSGTYSRLALFPLWPARDGVEALEVNFPEGQNTRVAMQELTAASEAAVLETWDAHSGRVLESHAAPVRDHFLEVQGLAEVWYGDDPLEAGPLAHYVTAAVLYRQLTKRPVRAVAYAAGFEADQAEAFRGAIDVVLDAVNPFPDTEADPGPPAAEPFDVLLVGGAYSGRVREHLEGLFSGDVRSELRRLEVIAGEGQRDWFSLTGESTDLVGALSSGPWDVVMMEEARLQAGMAGVYENRRQAFDVGAPSDYAVASYRFLNGGQRALDLVLRQSAASLVLVSPWAMRAGEPGLSLFPPGASPGAMRNYLLRGHEILLKWRFPIGNERVLVADLAGAWMAAEMNLPEINLYGDDGVFGGEAGHYLSAGVLYELITQFHIAGNAYQADLPEGVAPALQTLVAEVSGIIERTPVPEPHPDPADPVDDGGDAGGGGEQGGEDPGEDGEGQGAAARPVDLLLGGGVYTAAVEEHLFALFEADPRVRLRTLRRIGENGEDFFALTTESGALDDALADEAWDAVVMEAPEWQGGLAGVYANRRTAFGIGSPSSYALASYRYLRGGKQVIEAVDEAEGPTLVLVSPWALRDGEPQLTLFPREETPAAMHGYLLAGHDLLRGEVAPEIAEGVRWADFGAAWFAASETLPGLDLYGEDGVLGASLDITWGPASFLSRSPGSRCSVTAILGIWWLRRPSGFKALRGRSLG